MIGKFAGGTINLKGTCLVSTLERFGETKYPGGIHYAHKTRGPWSHQRETGVL